MNEPIQQAQKTTGLTTAAALLALVKRGNDGLSLFGEADSDRQSYSDAFVFEVVATNKDKKGVETRSELKVPGWVSNGNTSERVLQQPLTDSTHRAYHRYTKAFRPRRGHWWLKYNETLPAILDLLPADAEVAFQVYLDAGTNGYNVAADSAPDADLPFHGLHVDHLYLHAWWTRRGKRVERRFLLDATTSAHNSARFGGPRYEADSEGR